MEYTQASAASLAQAQERIRGTFAAPALLASPARSSWTPSRPIKPVRGLLLPSLCASLVMGEPPFAHPEGHFAPLHAHASALQARV
jgi:hypothetical protein